MIPGFVAHLWQSTLFAGAAWLLTLALRKNQAQVRYRIWFIASVKFLVPFSVLVGFGTLVSRRAAAPPNQTGWVSVAEQFGQPLFTIPAVAARVAVTSEGANRNYFVAAALILWACGFATIAIYWVVRWLRVRALRRAATSVTIPGSIELTIPVMSTPGLVEPGVFGILRPVLLMPEGIREKLDSAQLDAILAHELCHVRRRDNLTAAIHMVAQATFWFHPLVWWMGARLVDERERACDEEVLRLGNRPQVYAAGILNVCKLYIEAPLACVSGVTGSNLKKRIHAIMKNRIVPTLSIPRKVALAVAGVAAVAAPIIAGIVYAPAVRAQAQAAQSGAAAAPRFEVVSVKPNKSPDPGKALIQFLPGGRFITTNIPLIRVIAVAWDLPMQSQRLTLAPGVRMPDDIYDIEATPEKGAIPPGLTPMERFSRMKLMLQALLEDRFKLKIRRESKEEPIYALVDGKGGSKLEKSKFQEQDCGDTSPNWLSNPACHFLNGGQDRGIRGASVTITQVVLNVQNSTDRPLFDKTGLTGYYDIQTEGWAPMRVNPASLDGAPQVGDAGNSPERPTLFDVFEKLGLHMESQRAVIDMFVIDHVERPSEN